MFCQKMHVFGPNPSFMQTVAKYKPRGLRPRLHDKQSTTAHNTSRPSTTLPS
jgi:hypothetical protein